MSSSPRGIGGLSGGNQVVTGGGLQQEELQPEEFDALLHPNVLDTLADFDFSYPDLGGGLDAAQKPQQQPQQQQHLPSSPRPLTGRKRSFTQACTWDNLGPKALSEISASLLAGGGWDGVPTPPGAVGVDTPGPLCSPVNPPAHHLAGPPASAEATAAAAAPKQAAKRLVGGHNTRAPAAVGCLKSRRGSGAGSGAEGAGKRPLNPERMERKASREKRRREEVNEKFEQLMEVLEDAEVTSGLEPPAAKEGGKAAHACINGRRVEVLSRTINILKKLLQARRESLAAAAAAAAATSGDVSVGAGVGAAGAEEKPFPHAPESSAVGPEGTSAAPPARSVFLGDDSASAPLPANAIAEASDAACGTPKLEAAAATPQAVVHHMTMPMSGHHASLMMPPGFAGMPAPHGVPPGQHGMPGHQGQPIFIAVPMYMPQGQGMPPSSSSSSSSSSPLASENTAQAPAVPAALPSAADAPSAAPTAVAVAAETKEALGMAPPVKWAVPAGMGFQQMALQMPQFVTQALSAEEGDEDPTHAVCA